MYCKNCGNKQKDGQTFCPKCGTKYEVSPIETTKEELAHDDESETVHSEEEAKANNGNEQPASQGAVEPNLATGSQQENSSDNVEEVCELSAEEQNTYNLWMNILKWGGVAMAGALCFFPNSFSIAHVLLCLIVASAWGKKEKTLNTIKKMKLKTLACVGIFAFLLLYNHSGGGSGVRASSSDELEKVVKETGELKESEAKILVTAKVKSIMHNPDSYQSVSWSGFKKWGDKAWRITHTYRGTNGFGGTVTETHTFQISDDLWVISAD